MVGLALGLAVGLGVVAAAAGQAEPGGGQQQPHDEAVVEALGALLVLALALLLALTDVGPAEGVLGLVALLRAVGLVQKEQPGAAAVGLSLEKQAGDGAQQGPVACPMEAGQEAGDGGAVAGLGAQGVGGGRGGHTTGVVAEGGEEADEERDGGGGQAGGPKEVLDPGEGGGEDHGGLLPRARATGVVTVTLPARRAGAEESPSLVSRLPNKRPAQLQSWRVGLVSLLSAALRHQRPRRAGARRGRCISPYRIV